MLDKETKAELYRRGLEDPVYFCRVFLPAWFPKGMPWLHRGLLALLTRETDFLLNFGPENWRDEKDFIWDERGLDKILRHFVWKENPDDPQSAGHPIFVPERDERGAIRSIHLHVSQMQLEILPRGFSKTTIALAAIVRAIVYRLKKFIAYISESGPHAQAQLDNVKTQLESNLLLIEVFGVLAPERNHPNPWRDDIGHTLNDVWLVARGRGGQVRGLNRNAQRPDLIIVDDVEDEESVLTEAQRKKTMKWIMGAVRPALPRNDPDAFIQILGTMLHAEAMLPSLAKDPSVISVKFGAIDPDGDMIWNAVMTRAQYDKMRISYKSVGELSTFTRELDSAISNEEEQVFNTDKILYVARTREECVAVAVICDPAISENMSADFCAFAAVGITAKGLIHVFEVFMKRGMSPREQVDKYFELVFKWQATHKGVEAISYQKALVHLIREEMFRKARLYGAAAYFEVTEIRHNSDQDKIKRVQGVLAPRYAAGYITHQHRFPEFEGQLQDWPNSKKDGPDAVAMAVTLLDPHAGLALGDDMPGKVPEEDRWQDDDDLVGGNWRTAP